MPASSPARRQQGGNFLIGAIVGLLVGLALSLAVALYVTKVPVPFINKVPQRTAEQDAAEAEKNRNWDPNTPLHGRNPAASAAGAVTQSGPVLPPPPNALPTAPSNAASKPGGTAAVTPGPARPGSDLSTTGSGTAAATGAPDAFVYFVQAGAYAKTEEAEAQRAKLAIAGFESKITEREQAGRVMYRVRIGPFAQRTDAEKVKDTLDSSGTTTALVRVQK